MKINVKIYAFLNIFSFSIGINRVVFFYQTRVCFYPSIFEGVVSIDALTAKASDVIFTVSTTDSDSTQLTYSLSCTPTGCPFDILNSK